MVGGPFAFMQPSWARPRTRRIEDIVVVPLTHGSYADDMAWGSGLLKMRGGLRARAVVPSSSDVTWILAVGVLGTPSIALAQAGGHEVNALTVTPRVGVVYDSNVFQLNETRFSGDRSDTIVSPAIGVSFDRTIGRNNLSVTADLGYEFHRRFKSLDQADVSVSGRGSLGVTALCAVSPSGTWTVQQNNPGTGAVKNSQAAQNYSATLSCQRPFGLFPSITASYQSTTNSQELLSLFDQHTASVSGGIGYALPAVGTLLISVGTTSIRQPNRRSVDGAADGSDVFNLGASFDRAVAPRLSFSVGARYLSVDPLRATTQDYVGAGYNASVNYHPSPRVSLVASASRDVSGTGDVAVSYVLASNYGLTGTVNLSQLTSFNLAAQRFHRTYRGENPIFFPVARGSESGASLTGSLSHTLAHRVQLSAFATYTNLDARSDYYDYKRFQMGLSAGARF